MSGCDQCVVADCTYSTPDGSGYCTLHGVRWGRGDKHLHEWEPLRSVPPSWRCACGAITEARP